MKKTKILSLVKNTILIAIVFVLTSCNIKNKESQTNDVLEFFTKSELQYETKQQKENIIKALNDILYLPKNELENQKYPNYEGVENQWDLQTFLNRYFVPANQNITLGDNFYTVVKRKKIQNEIRKILDNLQNSDNDTEK